MKKIISFILLIAVISTTAFASLSFTDLTDGHWSFGYVEKLVNDGTVKGYEDGSFRPTNLVTRAEFVKMMGMGSERAEKEYADVPSTHWGYDYIMTSGFETTESNFYPDKPITRGETIELLWKRLGSVKNSLAPQSVIKQYEKNKDAVSWAYKYKVMIGDDGLNLRLSDNISRAEAATLIVRARETDFTKENESYIDSVSPELLKVVFESYDLFDSSTPYNADAKITNGELAKAALRIISYEKNLTYSKYNASANFNHTYAKDLTIIANKVLGESFANAEFADKNATMEDACAILSYAITEKSSDTVITKGKDNYYKDVNSNIDARKNTYLTFAYLSGIQINSLGTINATKELTHKDLAYLLIQFDSVVGTQTVYSTKKDKNGDFIKYDVSLNTNIATYPNNADKFMCIIDGVNKAVYEKNFTPKGSVEEIFSFSREFAGMFTTVLTKLEDVIRKSYNVDSEIVMYPNLVWDTGKGFSLRLKCKILSVPENEIDIKEMFGDMLVEDISGNLKPGMEIFIETSVSYAALIGM